MRIVMVTPDSTIDRRIIQEAVTLIQHRGDEVILIATLAPELPEHENIKGVKVERLDLFENYEILPFHNKVVLKLRKELIRLLGMKEEEVSGEMLDKTTHHSAVKRYLARVISRLSKITLWFLDHLSALKPFERYLMKRIVYYDPDLICAHDFPYLKAAVFAKRELNVPLVYDAHELYPEISTLTRKEKIFIQNAEMKLIKECDRVITVNPFLAKIMSDRYRITHPDVILNAASRSENFDPSIAHNHLREWFSIPERDKIILYQGWFSPERGLKDLIRAFTMLDNNYHLVLMGYGEYQQELFCLTHDLGISHKVHLKEAVSQSDLLFWTASADAGIIPYPPIDMNHFYCSPNKLFEFIQAALPIIANDLPYLKQVVEGEEFGIVATLDSPSNIAKAISIFFDPKQTNRMRIKQNMLNKAQAYYWTAQEPIFNNIYDIFRKNV